MKIIFIHFFISVLVYQTICTREELDEVDPSIVQTSQFIIKLLEKYDTSKEGLLPIENYPYFLRDVFLEGSELTIDSYIHS